MRMLQMMQKNADGNRRIVWLIDGKILLKAAAVKMFHKFFPPTARYKTSYEYNYSDKYLG